MLRGCEWLGVSALSKGNSRRIWKEVGGPEGRVGSNQSLVATPALTFEFDIDAWSQIILCQ
jgi:hypothetical protein